MQKAFLAILIGLVSGSATMPAATLPPVVATPFAIDPADPAHVRFGPLRYMAGWVLASARPEFGGYSALHVDGDHFLALADTGEYLSFRMTASGAIEDSRFARLPDFPGRFGEKSDRDSESMAVDPAGGDIWVGFEGYNAVFRYWAGFSAVRGQSRPAAMKDWPGGSGPESLARLSDGRFLIIAENAPVKDGGTEALLFSGDPADGAKRPMRFTYCPPPRYVPTDAAELPDGRVIVLNRHFSLVDGVWAALTIIDPRAMQAGQSVAGEMLAEFRPPLNIDNMEGVSVTREGDRTMLWLISDDNQLPFQHTLLMKFALDESGHLSAVPAKAHRR